MDAERREGGGRRLDRTFALGVALIVLVALALRLPHLDGGPGYENRDEMNYVPKAVRYGGGDLNPHYFHNPPLTSYLMFAANLAWYGLGRLTGEFASAADFKAQYVADAAAWFRLARWVVLTAGLAGVAHVACLARSLTGGDPRRLAARAAGWSAALLIAASPLHVERSALATNEILVTLFATLSLHAAGVFARSPSARTAALSGALAGLAASTKYTGAVAALPLAAAALAAPGIDVARRVRLVAVGAFACAAAFLVTCPWIVLDSATFFSHVAEQAGLKDRWQDGLGWRRYLGTVAGEGLGPAGTLLVAPGIVFAAARAVRGPAAERAERVAMLAGALGLLAFLLCLSQLAYGRYLLPALPALAALGAAEVVRRGPAPNRAGAALVGLAALIPLGTAIPPASDAYRNEGRTCTHDAMRAWMKDRVPDGAVVITDLHAPWFVATAVRDTFRAKVPDATWSRLTPAYRFVNACPYFAGEIAEVPGTGVRAGDWPGLARLGPAYVLVSSLGRDVYAKLPPADYPGAAWHASVAADLRLVHEVKPADELRGPTFWLYAVGN